jgi:glucose-1-phosphate adenylyltransferase
MDEEGFSKGNADELFRIRDQIISFDPDVLLVMSADHVYRLDFTDVLDTHRRKNAECTVVTTEVPVAEAGDHATVVHNRVGRVTGFEYKPDDPSTGTVATEIFVYRPEALLEVLEELHGELGEQAEERDTGLEDFGDHLVPRLVDRGRTYVHALEGYWRDLGQPHKYLRAHQDVLTDDVGVLSVPGWPILSRLPQRGPARVLDGAQVVDSLVSTGARVAGVVRRSVLGPGVVVEAGAEVCDSVVFADSTVRSGARVSWSIVDTGCEVRADAQVGDPDAAGLDDADAVTLLGRDSVVGEGVQLSAGSRLEPGTMA